MALGFLAFWLAAAVDMDRQAEHATHPFGLYW